MSGSVAVIYLFALPGVPLVQANASFSDCVGSRVSSSDRAIGSVGEIGATDILAVPFIRSVASHNNDDCIRVISPCISSIVSL